MAIATRFTFIMWCILNEPQYLVEIKMYNHSFIFLVHWEFFFVLTTFNMDTQMVIDLS